MKTEEKRHVYFPTLICTIILICVLTVFMAACAGTNELTGNFTFDAPEGFIETSEGVYEAECAWSNINVYSLPNDGSFRYVSAERLVDEIEEALEAQAGEDLDIEIVEEEYYEIDGRDAFKCTISYPYDALGITFWQTQCIIDDTEELFFITYTYVSEEEYEEYQDEFKASLDSIRFE